MTLKSDIEELGGGKEELDLGVNNWLDSVQLTSDLKDACEMKDFSGSQIRDRLNRSRRSLFEELLSLKQIEGLMGGSEYEVPTTTDENIPKCVFGNFFLWF